MRNQTLSAFPYYGGKATLAPVICDMLDYTNTEIFIEPFGGGARVLLISRGTLLKFIMMPALVSVRLCGA